MSENLDEIKTFPYLNPEKSGSKEKPVFLMMDAGEIAKTSLVRASADKVNYCFKFHGIIFQINPEGEIDYVDNQTRETDKNLTLLDIKDDFIRKLSKDFLKKE